VCKEVETLGVLSPSPPVVRSLRPSDASPAAKSPNASPSVKSPDAVSPSVKTPDGSPLAKSPKGRIEKSSTEIALGDKVSPRKSGNKVPAFVNAPDVVLEETTVEEVQETGSIVVARFKEVSAPVTIVFKHPQYQKEFCILVRAIQNVAHGKMARWKS